MKFLKCSGTESHGQDVPVEENIVLVLPCEARSGAVGSGDVKFLLTKGTCGDATGV